MKTIAANPKQISPFLRSWKWSMSFSIMSLTVSPLNLTPKIPLICDITIIMAVAVVKPEVTGVEIKSTRKPAVKRQNRIGMKINIVFYDSSGPTPLLDQ